MGDETIHVSPDLYQGTLELAAAMNAARVRYALIGGLAAGFLSGPRATRDIDFVLQVPKVTLPSLLADLAKRGFGFDEVQTIREWTQHQMTVLSYRGIRVDWIGPVLPVYDHVLARATAEKWAGQPIWVASPEGLIVLKLLSYRTQDLLDVENLVAAYGDRLDLNWIRAEWQALEGLDDPRMRKLDDLLAKRRRLMPG